MVAWFSCFENDATNAYPNPLHDAANIITCVVQVSWLHVLQIEIEKLKTIVWFSCFEMMPLTHSQICYMMNAIYVY